jgi:hypothetical protein
MAREGRISPDEFADLVVEHSRLLNEAAAREGTPDYEDAYNTARAFDENVIKPSETKTSDTFRAMQIKFPIDFSTVTGFRRMLQQELGRDMRPEEAPAFTKMARDVNGEKVQTNRKAFEMTNRVLNHFKNVKDISFDDAVKMLDDQITELTKPCDL